MEIREPESELPNYFTTKLSIEFNGKIWRFPRFSKINGFISNPFLYT